MLSPPVSAVCGKGREDCYPHARMFLVCLDQSLDDPEVQLSAHGVSGGNTMLCHI